MSCSTWSCKCALALSILLVVLARDLCAGCARGWATRVSEWGMADSVVVRGEGDGGANFCAGV